MSQHPPRKLRLLADPDSGAAAQEAADPAHLDAWRVEVWVSTDDTRPWLASSAIVDSEHGARRHASQSVSGLLVDGIEPGSVFVGAILGQVPIERAGDLDPGWVPHPGEPVAVTVIDDGDRLGLWMQEPQSRWRARTGLPDAAPPFDHDESPSDRAPVAGDPS